MRYNLNEIIKYPGSLHNHTDFSNFRLRDAINRTEDLIDYAIELGHKTLAITDHETIGSSLRALEHYAKVKKDNPDFKLILGNEIYLVRNGLTQENFRPGEDRYYHFILLAKDEIGHEQIRQISTIAWSRSYLARGMMRVPTYYQDLWDIIGKNPGHVVATTACLGGALGTQLMKHKDEPSDILMSKIELWATQLSKLFGEDNFFLEMQPSHNEEQLYVNKMIIELSKKLSIPTIISTDSHYLNKKMRPVHKAFLTSQKGEREVDSFYMSTYLMDDTEIREYMEKHIGGEELQKAYRSTISIYNRCEDYDLVKPLHIPYLPKNPLEPTKELVAKWQEKILLTKDFAESTTDSKRHLIAEILTRMDKDEQFHNEKTYKEVQQNLEAIDKSSGLLNTDWSAYMLNVKDYIDIIWDEGDSIVPVGRGSGGGFILNQILGITQMNPLREKTRTFSWRFLNPERITPLDIDIDIEASKRPRVYAALERNYGADRVSKILTLRTEKAKSAIQTAARGLGIDRDTSMYISSLVTADRGMDRTLTQMFYGDEEEGINPNKEFVKLMTKDYPELWEVSYSIEGLISGTGSHAGGVIFVDEPFYKSAALMKTNGGDVVTQFDLNDAEKVGLIKIDLLSLESADRIRKSLDLLIEYGYVQPEATLRETYEKTLGVYNLERDAAGMWKMAWNHEVTSLFQMEQQSGIQGIELTKPQSVDELAVLNSVIRLMAAERGSEQPVNKFARFKANPRAWINEMARYGLTPEEMEVIRPILSSSAGLCIFQEQFMELVQLPELGGHSLLWADRLRKAVSKKSPKDYEILEQEFFQTIEDKQLSPALADYVWNTLISMNKGYGFNSSHTMLYSFIALQELNLAYRFPIIFWNTASLIVDSGGVEVEEELELEEAEVDQVYTDGPVLFIEDEDEDDEDDDGAPIKTKKKTARKIDYGKIATAIGNYQSKGIEVAPPDINASTYTYSPDVKNNVIKSGLNGITRVGEALVQEIIKNRPYYSSEDFLKRVKVNKPQMVNLIKSGAFDEFDDRIALMKDYITSISDQKKVLNLRNMKMLTDYKVFPEELTHAVKVWHFTKYIRKSKDGIYYKLDEISERFFGDNYDLDDALLESENGVNTFRIEQKLWDSTYNKEMDPIRKFLKDNQEELLEKINSSLVNEMWEKYAAGSISKWEMDSVSYYSHEHELAEANLEAYNFKGFYDLPEEPVTERVIEMRGKPVALLEIERIAGTVLDRDKGKRTVTLLTMNGVATIKIYGPIFAHYDKQISVLNSVTGKKKVVEKSMFTRGNKIVVAGIRKGNFFIGKKYKKHPFHLVEKIEEIKEDGSLVLSSRS